MVKISNTFLKAGAIREGLKKLVKMPSSFLKSKKKKEPLKKAKEVEKPKYESKPRVLESEKPSEVSKSEKEPEKVTEDHKKNHESERRESFKLKFRNFSGSANEFKQLLDSKAQKLGSYSKINFKTNKVVVTLGSKEVMERYLEFFNKHKHKDQELRVSVLDYFDTLKSEYKVLSLKGVPDEYEEEAVKKGIKRRTNIEFKIKKEGEKYKLKFKTVSDCVRACSILNKAKLPLVRNKKETLVQVTVEMTEFGKGSKNSSRVFVRNLPFGTTQTELVNFFKKFDKGAKVHVPSKSKGFAFVTFSSLEKSKKVINEVNGTMFKKRRIQLTLSLPKELYKSKGVESKEDEEKEDEYKENKENKNELNEQKIKVKINGNLEKEKEKRLTENNDVNNDGVNNYEDYDYDGEDNDPEDENEEGEEEEDGSLKDTIFVRNLDYDCTESELSEYFSKFGEVESSNICRTEDKTSKGTAFVRFKREEDVRKILENEKMALLRDEELNTKKPTLGVGYTLRGRRLKLDLAVEKEKAKVLKDQKAKDESKKVNQEKNLHLLMVGVMREDSPEFKKLNESQKEAFKESLEQKLKKINQKYTYVNPTRICIKNLPSSVNSNDLRNVIIRHLRSTLSGNEFEKLKKLKNRGILDVKLLKGDSYRKDASGLRVKKKKPFAFVKLVDHNIAMRTLELFSNNQTLYKPKVLQCEFTIDTAGLGESKSEERKTRLKRKKYSRGKRQRERRRMEKMNQSSETTSGETNVN